MRDDFAVFILTHGRADNQKTLKMLKSCGYKGKYFLVVDDLDEQLPEYKKRYGNHVIVFNKMGARKTMDTFHNTRMLTAVVFARNVVFDIAREKGISCFAMCDDDVSRLNYKVIEKDKLKTLKITKNIEKFLEAYVEYQQSAKITVLGMCEDGVFIGGGNQLARSGYTPSVGKFMFYRTDDEVKYRGLFYEDNISTFDIPLQGRVSFSPTCISTVSQVNVKKSARGGMKKAYDFTSEEYVCCFMVLMAHPSGVKIVRGLEKWKMRKKISNLRPMIISEKYREAGGAEK